MHSYLKAIGFSDIAEKKELDAILQDVIQNYDEKTVVEDRSNHLLLNYPSCTAAISVLQSAGNMMKKTISRWNIISLFSGEPGSAWKKKWSLKSMRERNPMQEPVMICALE